MSTPTDNELNRRIIELSKAVSSLFEKASSTGDVPALRDEALRAIADQSEAARNKLSRSSS